MLETPLDRWMARAAIVAAIRRHFAERDFLEVDTPVLLRAPAPERFIDAIAVPLAPSFAGHEAEQRFLQASPELAMKQILARGVPRVMQLAPAFRDGDRSGRHRPEFRLLEWYRAHADWQTGMADAEALLRLSWAAWQRACPHTNVPRWAQQGRLDLPLPRLRYDDALQRYAGLTRADAPNVPLLREAMKRCGLPSGPSDDYDELCQRVWVGCVEPQLAAAGQAVLVTHFPMAMAGFAAPCAEVPDTCERFELYVGDLELCNGFTELCDASLVHRRFAAEAAARRAQNRRPYPIAEAFFRAMAHMPPAVGVAMGLERLLMACAQTSSIDEVSFVRFDDV